MSDDLTFRFAAAENVSWLAKINQELLRDEGHRNIMSPNELVKRMKDFL